MGILKVVIQITFLFILYRAGISIQETFHLSVPGSIIGMLLLFLLLSMKIVKVEWIEKGALLLIKYLPLLFLPITVGVITFFDVFIGKGFFIIVIVLISTTLVMVSSGLISQFLLKEKVQEHE
ncbi:CidA/LrgA family holin-like protein [Lederbergia lenta]|uniref:Putative murein hydrolase exporter, LrgA n=1 Tax=Lederbergia lenta TaxID=1467 RepID=A0A2X4W372_LEDLE|nr:CidA/LrgA family holin-like protein [Lederbergia lenta]MCM3113197.1 CidA/LrgA family holin-like protein [Lederbergia lenta]MEC2326015.1 CidA/LrgA family holin-like protein [Lederbergia lenta]SQI53362.1 putative murein hydrolase exporter, LrgA [Lederbergia lenta]